MRFNLVGWLTFKRKIDRSSNVFRNDSKSECSRVTKLVISAIDTTVSELSEDTKIFSHGHPQSCSMSQSDLQRSGLKSPFPQKNEFQRAISIVHEVANT